MKAFDGSFYLEHQKLTRKRVTNMNKLLDAMDLVEDLPRNDDNDELIGRSDTDDDDSGDTRCLVSLSEERDAHMFDNYPPPKNRSCENDITFPRLGAGYHNFSRALKRKSSETSQDATEFAGNKPVCLRTDVFGKLKINGESTSITYYNGFEKIFSDGTIQRYVLGDKVYLLPASIHEDMYIAQIESIYVARDGNIHANCHWFKRLKNNEIRLTKYSDDNPVECIEGLCDISQFKKDNKLYCKGKSSNGWFY